MMKPSKELVSAVLGKKVSRFELNAHLPNMVVIQYEGKDPLGNFLHLNIHELAHMVKEWFLDTLKQPSVDIHYNLIYKMIVIRHHKKGVLFEETIKREEDEWLLLGEWLLEDKGQVDD